MILLEKHRMLKEFAMMLPGSGVNNEINIINKAVCVKKRCQCSPPQIRV